jgi:preprotein translocase subunit YajC
VKGLEQLLPFVLIAVVFWLLLIRPQRRRQMELVRTQKALEIGDEVLLGAGIVARVATLGDEYLHVEVSPGVQMKVARQAIVRVLRPEEQPLDDRIGDDGGDEPDGHPTDVPDDRPPAGGV